MARVLIAVVLATTLGLASVEARQPAPPALTGPVNDFAGVIDAASAAEIARLSEGLLAASGDAVVVATVKTVQPWADLQSYATRMFENGGRGLGGKNDTGLLVLLALDERQVWIEVGYGLEGAVTDGFAGETSRRVMTPYFRQGQYGPGLAAGTRRLVERIARDRGVQVTGVGVPAESQPPVTARRSRSGLSPLARLLIFVVLLVIVARMNRSGGRRGRRRAWHGGVGPWGGGYYGGGWGGGSSWGGGSWGGSSGGFGGFGGGRSGGGGGGASW